MDDILLVDKSQGISSFDVIRRLRKELGVRKMGHAGTLDPRASGLLIIGIEKGTKKLEQFLKLDKVYETIVRLGERRSTGDLDGEVLEEVGISDVSIDTVRGVLSEMVGVLELPVPAYSAIKQGGIPLYKKARQGKTVETPVRSMQILSAEVLSVHPFVTEEGKKRVDVAVRFHVASGVYIRSLAEELGRRLGYPATVAELRRTAIGDFYVADARSV